MTLQGRKALVATEIGQTWSFRGSKSRNKVSVGEPAEGSLQIQRVFTETSLNCSAWIGALDVFTVIIRLSLHSPLTSVTVAHLYVS